MTGFKEYEPDALRIPVRGPFGQLVASTFGELRDDELALLRVALLSRLPARCPDDALGFVGEGLSIERYAADTDASYRARIEDPFAVWAEAGSPGGIEDQIRAFGIPDVEVYLNFDGHFANGEWYSRFWIVLGPDFGTTGIARQKMPFQTGPGVTLGSTATRDQVVSAKRIILKWKSAHSYPVLVVLRFYDGTLQIPNTSLLGIQRHGSGLFGVPSDPPSTLRMPFQTSGALQSCRWPLGKLFGEQNFTNMPSTMGGFII